MQDIPVFLDNRPLSTGPDDDILDLLLQVASILPVYPILVNKNVSVE